MNVFQFSAVSDSAAAAGIIGFFLLLLIVIGVLSIFWIWMLIDCLISTLPPVEKLI